MSKYASGLLNSCLCPADKDERRNNHASNNGSSCMLLQFFWARAWKAKERPSSGEIYYLFELSGRYLKLRHLAYTRQINCKKVTSYTYKKYIYIHQTHTSTLDHLEFN